ncbi:hypothetical protein VTN96DRAFT_9024 [Rasamsonia emersonii]|uniref:ATPase synthesis protein 25 n=1 Tax=Rasamsonia emersonii (strain ATCC 16479 / CBS 393.64 / IMI 116815) TaxID=1408163 RepID=A0A0F4YN25_RASE3|nr:hypothetical protein T310_6785 [Rasamsonia emersonii CBS 393.64]KKA19246.1 hypothetical protein T310_6785 [Rasamsonia emersonii CBS 393.64]
MMNSALVRGARCYVCRYNILQSFVAISGISISQPVGHVRSAGKLSFRSLSTVSYLRSQNSGLLTQDAGADEIGERKEEHNPSAASQPVPWYLQVESQTPSPQPLSQRQQIPDLPENPPTILEDLLKHLHVEIGLDDMTLLDLRGRDPPPALGGNVIMIIGTARSLKHLNVSADRFCRWLRSTYKLRPYADGLLGRNELKIKLRRKARRARLASNTGAALESDDDGITTGWICVNVGIVDDKKEKRREEAFEGFGKIAGGTRIVVQMFTEEKRAEVNLEQLWGEPPKPEIQEETPTIENTAAEHLGEVRDSPDPIRHLSSDRGFGHLFRPPASIALNQQRGFATSCSLRANRNDSADTIPSTANGVRIQGHSRVDFSSIFYPLSRLPPEKVKAELGNGPDDRDSTFFLQLLYSKVSNAHPAEISEARLKLLCVGTSVQHPLYTKELLWEAFEEHTCSGYPLTDELAFEVVSALLTPRSVDTPEGTRTVFLPDPDRELALRVLDFLSLRGTDVLNMNVFNKLYKAASSTNAPSTDKMENGPEQAEGGNSDVSRIARVMAALELPFDPEEVHVHMEMRFKNKDFEGFWRLWNSFPFYEVPRRRRDYELLFRLHAELGDPARARDCVSTWGYMMEREEPPVELQGEVVQHLMSCIRLSDPSIEGRKEPNSDSYISKLWNRCMIALEKDK